MYPDADGAVRQVLGEEAVAQALRFDPAKAAALLGDLDQSRVTTRICRRAWPSWRADARGAAALLAELPPPTTRRARVERGVLRALSLLERDVEAANADLREALDGRRARTVDPHDRRQGPDVHKLLLSFAPTPATRVSCRN